MKAVADLNLPANLMYTKEHIWAVAQGNEILVGVSDFAQDQLGEVVFVDLPQAGASFKAGDGFGTVESIKSVNTLFMPLDGEVTAVNADLEDNPTLVNASCYEKGWMIRITADQAGLAGLLSADAYRAQLG